jgi:hypothetical protein
MSRLLGALAVSVVLTVGLTGCLQLSPRGSGSAGASHAPAPTEEPAADDTNAAFGDAVTYIDGVSISVSTPAEFTPSQYAAGAEQAHNVVFNITITNGSEENLQPTVYTRVSSGGVEASSIFDVDNDLSGGPSTVILPDGTVTWKEAYSIADLDSIIVQVAPSFDYDDSIFTNAG